MEHLLQDIRYGARMLGRKPGFTVVAVLVLGLGIGANTAMFSLINALLLKPIVAEQPEALVRVFSKDRKPEGGFRSFSYPNYADLRDRNTALLNLAAFSPGMVGMKEGDITRRSFSFTVTANWFTTFGVRPALGRDFLPEEEKPGAGIPVVIVSHAYWTRHGSDPSLVGRSITINGRPMQVIGIAPEGFTGVAALFSPDVWLPMGMHEYIANDFQRQQGRKLNERDNHTLMLLGRLKPGLTPAQAEAQLQPIATQLEQAYPKENQDQTLVVTRPPRLSISTNPQNEGEVGGLAALLLPMSGVVLLIASLNLANMLLARGAARRKELAIRTAMGGSRWRVTRQLLTEGFLLSLLGGALALVISYWSSKALAGSLDGKLPMLTLQFDARPDLRILLATFGFCVLAALLSSLLPAWKLSRVDVMHDLKEQAGESARAIPGRSLFAPRHLLVVGQLSLSFVLLAVAGLFFRGASNAAHANPGFRFEQGVLIEVDGGLAGLTETQSRGLYHTALERLRALPGVQTVSMASSVPFGMYTDGRSVRKPGNWNTVASTDKPKESGRSMQIKFGSDDAPAATNNAATGGEEKPIGVGYNVITDDYFKSLGVAMLRGREFDRLEADASNPRARVTIISESLARQLWPKEEAVGRQLEIVEKDPGKAATILEIVGVCPDFLQSLGDKDSAKQLYVPFGQSFQSWMNFHVRLARPDIAAEAALLRTARNELRAVSDTLPVLSANTLRDFHNEGVVLWMFKVGSRLFFAFAALALLLSVVGVYGVKAFVVSRRTREIGIRIALGATTRQVLWMILSEGVRLTVVGLAIGLGLALGVGKLLSSRLYEVSGADPVTFGVATVVLAASALLACYLPARRAARIEPTVALRYE